MTKFRKKHAGAKKDDYNNHTENKNSELLRWKLFCLSKLQRQSCSSSTQKNNDTACFISKSNG